MALLQWNCNGFDRNLAEIRQLMSTYAASVICLQESRIHPDRQAVLRNFHTYTKDRVYQGLAAGGVTTFVRTDLYSVELPLCSQLESIAVQVALLSLVPFL